MIAVIQRVTRAHVSVEGRIAGAIGRGLLILLGARRGDTEDDACLLATRCINLRIFDDENALMNRSLMDVDGSVLVISQFTLLANCRKGRRPSFTDAAPPADARRLVDLFVATVLQTGLVVQTGVFGARMEVDLLNEGPVTLVLDSQSLRTSRRASG